jgi:hypothetical protein
LHLQLGDTKLIRKLSVEAHHEPDRQSH